MKKISKNRYVRIICVIVLIIVGVLAIGLASVYVWPLRNTDLQTGTAGDNLSYVQATAQYEKVLASERQEPIIDNCNSTLYTHDKRTTKSVVMFHGVTACPEQFSGLAKTFFDAGYNVYVPKAPYHGLADSRLHGQVRSKDLINYVNRSVTIADGLGDEVGVVGLSGGGMLSTWAAEYRPEISRALVLSPYYEPAAAQVPKWQLPLLNVLYGLHVLPDQFTVAGGPDEASFSYRALGNYNIITKNLKSDPSGLPLTNFATIISADDDQIDLDLAYSIPKKIADANDKLKLTRQTLPAEWELGHDIVSLQNQNVAARSDQLFNLYLRAYEGQSVQIEP